MRIVKVYKTLLWVSMVIVLILSLIPMHGPASVSGQDKLHHFIAYAFLCWLAIQSYRHRFSIISIGLALVFLGLVIELAQYFTGYRYAEIADALANTAGILLVVMLTYLWHYLE